MRPARLPGTSPAPLALRFLVPIPTLGAPLEPRDARRRRGDVRAVELGARGAPVGEHPLLGHECNGREDNGVEGGAAEHDRLAEGDREARKRPPPKLKGEGGRGGGGKEYWE